uniref:Uncharacterized protein n=1 Tax=Amphimedon queenslandica TaxID=400682 RepID=A0A1X7SZA8_AMPQE
PPTFVMGYCNYSGLSEGSLSGKIFIIYLINLAGFATNKMGDMKREGVMSLFPGNGQ